MKKRNWRLMLRRVLNLVLSRIVVTGVLLLLQAFWLFALFYWLRTTPNGSAAWALP